MSSFFFRAIIFVISIASFELFLGSNPEQVFSINLSVFSQELMIFLIAILFDSAISTYFSALL